MAKYLKLQFKTGTLFETSKEPQEGFTEYSWDAIGDKPAGKAYRKEVQKVHGTLESAKLEKAPYTPNPYQFSFSLKTSDGEYVVIQTEVINKYGGFDPYLTNLTSKLLNMRKGQEYTVSAYAWDKKDDGNISRGFTILDSQANKLKGVLTFSYKVKDEETGKYTGEIVNGDVPMVEEIIEEDIDGTKKTRYDSKEKTKFLFNTLRNWVDTSFTQQQEEPVKQKEDVGKANDLDDDLPF